MGDVAETERIEIDVERPIIHRVFEVRVRNLGPAKDSMIFPVRADVVVDARDLDDGLEECQRDQRRTEHEEQLLLPLTKPRPRCHLSAAWGPGRGRTRGWRECPRTRGCGLP